MWSSFKNFVVGLIIRPLKELADGVKAWAIFFFVWAICLLIAAVVVGLPLFIVNKGDLVAPGIGTFFVGTFLLSSWLGTIGQGVTTTNLRSKPLNNKVKGE